MIPHRKTADSKGRLTLGPKFANRDVIVEQVDDTEVRVILARVVPERDLRAPDLAADHDQLLAAARRKRPPARWYQSDFDPSKA